MKNNDDVDCSFDDINIDDIDIDEIKDQIYSYNCTFENKLKLQKYYFINKFIPETPIQDIAKAWDGRHQSILDALSELYHRDNIFKEIQEYNNWDTLIDPEKCQKVEFSDDVLTHIMDKYTDENGVRTLKRCLELTISKLNVLILTKGTDLFSYDINVDELPIKLTNDNVDTLLKEFYKDDDDKDRIQYAMYM